jgi:nucleotide-binding universal stress UspA family protein
MFKKILIPLDGSAVAESVLPQARELVARLDVDTIFLLHIYPGSDELLPAHQAYLEHTAEIIRAEAAKVRAKLPGIRGGVSAGKPDVEIKLATGHPAEQILDFAEQKQVNLILMATHGRSGIRRWVLGSVADKVLSMSGIPVWLVRAGKGKNLEEGRKASILVPLDGSKLAESVLPYVEAVAGQRGIQFDLILLQVCEPPVILSDYPEATMPLSWERHTQVERDEAKQNALNYLSAVGNSLKEKGFTVRLEARLGAAADEIADYSERKDIYLITMSTHGRSGLLRWAYGSVADRVMHEASSPLLLVRPFRTL